MNSGKQIIGGYDRSNPETRGVLSAHSVALPPQQSSGKVEGEIRNATSGAVDAAMAIEARSPVRIILKDRLAISPALVAKGKKKTVPPPKTKIDLKARLAKMGENKTPPALPFSPSTALDEQARITPVPESGRRDAPAGQRSEEDVVLGRESGADALHDRAPESDESAPYRLIDLSYAPVEIPEGTDEDSMVILVAEHLKETAQVISSAIDPLKSTVRASARRINPSPGESEFVLVDKVIDPSVHYESKGGRNLVVCSGKHGSIAFDMDQLWLFFKDFERINGHQRIRAHYPFVNISPIAYPTGNDVPDERFSSAFKVVNMLDLFHARFTNEATRISYKVRELKRKLDSTKDDLVEYVTVRPLLLGDHREFLNHPAVRKHLRGKANPINKFDESYVSAAVDLDAVSVGIAEHELIVAPMIARMDDPSKMNELAVSATAKKDKMDSVIKFVDVAFSDFDSLPAGDSEKQTAATAFVGVYRNFGELFSSEEVVFLSRLAVPRDSDPVLNSFLTTIDEDSATALTNMGKSFVSFYREAKEKFRVVRDFIASVKKDSTPPPPQKRSRLMKWLLS